MTKIHTPTVSNSFSKCLRVPKPISGSQIGYISWSGQFWAKKKPDQKVRTNFWKCRVGRVQSGQIWLRRVRTKTPFLGSGLFCSCRGSYSAVCMICSCNRPSPCLVPEYFGVRCSIGINWHRLACTICGIISQAACRKYPESLIRLIRQ